jgi:hypothetical protein
MGSPNERLFIDALDALERGESIESILTAHPVEKVDLLPVLETAARLAQIRVAHSLVSQSSSKRKMLERAADLRGGAERPKVLASFFRRFALSAVPLAMVLIILVSGVFLASQSAVPGDLLYGAKRAAEDMRSAITIDPQARQTLRSEYEQERILEINALLKEGKTAQVEFNGFIEVIGEESWIIAGLRVQLEPETRIDGEPRIGYRARVKGETVAGRLTAREISVTESGTILPQPDPDRLKIDPLEQIEPLPTETPTRTPQPSPTPSETPSPTITLPPTPSPEPTQSPAMPPTPDDGVDDGEEGADDGVDGADDGVDDGEEGGDDGVDDDEEIDDDGVEDDEEIDVDGVEGDGD